MGKRKTTTRAQLKTTKKAEKVPTVFDCPFCNHEAAVEAKMQRLDKVATIKCRVCAASWQMRIHELDEPIDVYSAWLDECKRENEAALDDDQKVAQTAADDDDDDDLEDDDEDF